MNRLTTTIFPAITLSALGMVLALTGCGDTTDPASEPASEKVEGGAGDSRGAEDVRDAEDARGAQDARGARDARGAEPEPMTAGPDPDRQSPEVGEAPWVETTLINREGEEIGTLSIEPVEQGVRLALHAEGLSPGAHAVHFHEHGTCEPPDFQSAGGHYNPTDAQHGMPDSDEELDEKDHHVGDMLNQDVNDQEVLDTVMVNNTAILGEGPTTLLDDDGSALIIHAKADDYESQPSGAAGDRVACAPITREQTVGTR